jgi:hypothetical protein
VSISIERAASPEVPWATLDRAPDRTIFQTREWLDFLTETQGAEPVIGRVLDGPDSVGWFTGAMTRQLGVRFLGSPLRGWTTAGMGFTLAEGVDRTMALAALPAFAFSALGCIHLEFADRSLLLDEAIPPGFAISHLQGYELDLADDATMLAAMKSYGRRDVRRSMRNGIVVEEVDPADPGDFAATYYAQVSEAFAKRTQVPTYPLARVEAMIRHLAPTDRLLLLRAILPTGEVAATGLFPGLPGGTAEYWMGASWRSHQALLPNEALMWAALRTWRARGAVRFNFGAGGKYKAKYGGTPHAMPWVRCSRFAALEHARRVALDVYQTRRRLR